MTTCAKCNGKGAVRYVWPNPKSIPKPIPCYWFNKGAHPCDECDGTGDTARPEKDTP